jgi:hypothetical protein
MADIEILAALNKSESLESEAFAHAHGVYPRRVAGHGSWHGIGCVPQVSHQSVIGALKSLYADAYVVLSEFKKAGSEPCLACPACGYVCVAVALLHLATRMQAWM